MTMMTFIVEVFGRIFIAIVLLVVFAAGSLYLASVAIIYGKEGVYEAIAVLNSVLDKWLDEVDI